jgi:hypothetical protein
MTQEVTSVKRSRTVAVGAQVDPEFRAELEVIRQQRGDRFISDTIRTALEDFARRHWLTRVDARTAVAR